MLFCLFASLRPPPRLVCFAVLLVVVVGFRRLGRRKCRLFFGVVAVAATTIAAGPDASWAAAIYCSLLFLESFNLNIYDIEININLI